MANETQHNPTLEGLSSAKLTVIEALLAGSTVTDAAKAGGVSRGTVYDWLRTDVEFVAELNARRRELREALTAKLESLADSAVYCIEQAVARDGVESGFAVKTAFRLLEGLGLLSGQPPPIGPDNPERLRADGERQG
jgi:hypothetical protein